MDELIHELIPVLRPTLADFGRIRRISRVLAALPVAVTPARIHSRENTLVALKYSDDTVVLTNGGGRYQLSKFRTPKRWELPSFYIELGDTLYRVHRAYTRLLRLLGYGIMTAFNEFNHNGRLQRQFFYPGAVLTGSALQLIEGGAGVYICADGLVVSSDALVGDKLGISYTRLRLCSPPPESAWCTDTSAEHN